MIAKDLINYMIPPLKPTDTVEKALNWMEELHITQLPVVEEGSYKGILTQDNIYDNNGIATVVGNVETVSQAAFINQGSHYYEVLKLAYKEGLSIVAVTDDSGYFIGVVSIEDVVEAFAQTSAIKSPGAILVLSMPQMNYSLAEISRLVESNDVKILSSYIENDAEDQDLLKVTLKLSTEDASRVIATLERFNYNIIATYSIKEYADVSKDRYDILMKYLTM